MIQMMLSESDYYHDERDDDDVGLIWVQDYEMGLYQKGRRPVRTVAPAEYEADGIVRIGARIDIHEEGLY